MAHVKCRGERRETLGWIQGFGPSIYLVTHT